MDASKCSEFSKCMEILQLMLDNEASKDECEYVNTHIDDCIVCFEHYKVEKQIRELIKAKCSNLPVPADLTLQIQAQIKSIQAQ